MSLLAFFEQLAESSWSIDLHESQYAYSIVESIHVWTLCVFFGTVAMVDLRLLGWTMRGVPVSEFARRMLPWTVAAFVIMVISGSLLVLAIPVRTYQSIFFRGKMILLVLAGLNILFFHSRVYPKVAALGCRRCAAEGREGRRRGFSHAVVLHHRGGKNDRL